MMVNRNFNSNNMQSYYSMNPAVQVSGNNMVDISNFPVNRQNMQAPMNNSFVNLNLSNPMQKQFYVSYLPESGNNQDQVLPDSGSGQEKTEEEEEEYAGDNLAENNNI